MNSKLYLFVFVLSLFGAVGITSCKRSETSAFTKDEAIAQALEGGGELAEVIGDEGQYQYAYTFHTNYGESQPGDTDGTSRGGHTMVFQQELDHFHRISVFENTEGGALLVGVRYRVDKEGNTIQDEDNTQQKANKAEMATPRKPSD